MRATQFHELPAQLIAMTPEGPQARIVDLRPVQTVAARTVAGALLDVAEAQPAGRAPDLAGPEPGSLVELAREFVARQGEEITVIPDTETAAGIPPGTLLPGEGARIQGPPSRNGWRAMTRQL
jgi:uncharacterized protein YbjT (DUF2867 family)